MFTLDFNELHSQLAAANTPIGGHQAHALALDHGFDGGRTNSNNDYDQFGRDRHIIPLCIHHMETNSHLRPSQPV